MLIKLISVDVQDVPGKKYRKIEVAFRNDKGEVKGKNVMDFAIQKGLDHLIKGKTGDMLDVLTVKEGEYWNWKEIKPAGAGESVPTPTPTTGYSSGSKGGYVAPARDFESKEERAARQVMIVRQSSISSAVGLLKTEKSIPSVQEILNVARAFEEFVLKTGTNVAEVANPSDGLEDDIPY